MPATYDKIASTTLSSAGTITFSSIPSTYTDLRLILTGGTTRGTTSDSIRLQYNSDTGTNYSSIYIRGNGSAISTAKYSSQTSQFIDGIRLVGTTYGLTSMIIYDIFNYSNTSINKSTLARSSGAEDWGAVASVGLWRNTAAISTIYLQGDTVANFAIGTTAVLYGIKAA